MWVRLICGIAVAAALVWISRGATTPARVQPKSARLLWWWSLDDRMNTIHCQRSDGTGHRVVRRSVPGWGPTVPFPSPDGRWVAFQDVVDSSEYVYVMRADGSDCRRVSEELGLGYWITLSWTPDSQRIVYESRHRGDRNQDLFAVDVDGTGTTRLTSTPDLAETGPRISPDGRWIAYHREHGVWVAPFAAPLAGHRISPAELEHAWQPTWSPDSAHIAFNGRERAVLERRMYPLENVYLAKREGEPRALTTAGGTYPSWSPDGRSIVFQSFRASPASSSLWLMDADGDHQRPLSGPNVCVPRWSPDGDLIAYQGHANGRWTIGAIDPDGKNPREIYAPASNLQFAWQP